MKILYFKGLKWLFSQDQQDATAQTTLQETLFQVVPHQEVNLGTNSLSCKKCSKSIAPFPIFKTQKTLCQSVKRCNSHLQREIFLQICACASPSFSKTLFSLKLNINFILRNNFILKKVITFSERKTKIEITLHQKLTLILPSSAVI